MVRWLGALAAGGALLGACSSDAADSVASSPGGVSSTTVAASSTSVTDTPATLETANTGDSVDPEVDFCTTIPDAAAVEAAIGVAVKSPLAVGDPTSRVSCTYQRSADDFPGITFSAVYGRTLEQERTFVQTNFPDLDIVPIAEQPGFSKGPGDAVYVEADGNLYSAQATIDGDGVAAAVALLRVWLGV